MTVSREGDDSLGGVGDSEIQARPSAHTVIDGDFIPRPLASIVAQDIDGELLLVDAGNGNIHVLNPVGSIVWQCFDGETPLSELVADLAAAFGAPSDVVGPDVLALAGDVARAHLLAGFEAPTQGPPATTVRLELGDYVTVFTLPDLQGDPVPVPRPDGRTLLVNWSHSCGYCTQVARPLAQVQSALAERQIEVVLLADGEPDANAAMLDEHGLDVAVLLRSGATEPFVNPFAGVGTPVACLLEPDGRVAAPMAYGAFEVGDLALEMAGLQSASDEETGGDSPGQGTTRTALTAPTGICGPGGGVSRTRRRWARTAAYDIGGRRIGIRANSDGTDELLAHVLAAYRVTDHTWVPDNFSVVLSSNHRGPRDINLLLAGETTVVRSRSSARVLRGLANHLSSLVPTEDDLLRTSSVGAALGAQVGAEAILLPRVALQWLDRLQPALGRIGIRLVDQANATIDPTTNDLIVPTPVVRLDEDVMATLTAPPPGPEPAPVEVGRYPLVAWLFEVVIDGVRPLSRARTVASILPTMVSDLHDAARIVTQLDRLVAGVPGVAVPCQSPDELMAALKLWLRNQ